LIFILIGQTCPFYSSGPNSPNNVPSRIACAHSDIPDSFGILLSPRPTKIIAETFYRPSVLWLISESSFTVQGSIWKFPVNKRNIHIS